MVELDTHWTEILAFIFAGIGLILGIVLQESIIRICMVFLAGLIAGRIYYAKKNKTLTLPSIIVIFGFIVGYALGSVFTGSSLNLLFFGVAFISSSYIHSEPIIAIFKSAKPFK